MVELVYKGKRWRRPSGQFASKEEIKEFLGRVEPIYKPSLNRYIDPVTKKIVKTPRSKTLRKKPKPPKKKKPEPPKPPKKKPRPRTRDFLYTYYFRCRIESPPYEVKHYMSFYGVDDGNRALQLHDEIYNHHINQEIHLANIQHFKKCMRK
ncbi:MAG: hypothetical protein ACOC56_03880 [Atribacterota bacterium]